MGEQSSPPGNRYLGYILPLLVGFSSMLLLSDPPLNPPEKSLVTKFALEIIPINAWNKFDGAKIFQLKFIDISEMVQELGFTPTDNPPALQLVMKIPHAFRLCFYHSKLHRNSYGSELSPRLHQAVNAACEYGRFRTRIDSLEPFSRQQAKETDYGEPEKVLQILDNSGFKHFTFVWSIIHRQDRESVKRRVHKTIRCDWFAALYLREIHKRHDRSAKCEERMAWILGMGGSDASALQ